MPDPPPATTAATTALPTGTVTFLMSDIEGSTRSLQALGDRYAAVLDDHYRILSDACTAAGGTQVSTEGDATFFAFRQAPAALRAGVEAQRRLESHAWPPGVTVRVRMGIHTGDGRLMGSNYVGLDVHRVARIASAGHGGQILVSAPTRALAEHSLPEGAGLLDLGQHLLKDLEAPEHLFQLVVPDLPSAFPPLRSLGGQPDHLPARLTSFVGRDREKRELLELLGRSRLLTLTGRAERARHGSHWRLQQPHRTDSTKGRGSFRSPRSQIPTCSFRPSPPRSAFGKGPRGRSRTRWPNTCASARSCSCSTTSSS